MDTKFSVALLSGLSLFMSLGAFAVSEEGNNELNWSYAMGGTMQAEPNDFDELTAALPAVEPKNGITCTEGCPARAPKKELTLTYEDEAMPLRDRMEALPTESTGETQNQITVRDKMAAKRRIPSRPSYTEESDYQSVSVRAQGGTAETVSYQSTWEQPQVETRYVESSREVQNMPPQVETRYVESNPQVQYPITRQYPISVQYPVTVQRNMTVEQPVIMQQPVIVRRPVVVQQDVTVRRQPTVIQQQPVLMQQQPSFIQQQPMVVQAPAVPMTQETLNSINGMFAQPQMMPMQAPMGALPMTQPQVQLPQPQMPLVQPQVQPQMPAAQMTQATQPDVQQMPMAQNTYMPYAQQYQVQGQIQAQPIYTTMPPMYVQAPMVQQPAVAPQQQTQAY
ncbi:MAG: hypothetical protein IKS41_04755 [Alphaproteobacteria bacterium]|nr:hypothetical protein [Alphaproteobacteria bacterium]